MGERRREQRQVTTDHEVRCLTELPDGTVLEGTVADYSKSGARVAGPTRGIRIGESARLTFVFPTQERVGYECSVIHVAPDGDAFGVAFSSGPTPIKVLDV
ncbi:MAG: PilZ domain-containing protein [Phycisphaerae bacterium]|jgi:hypothetical protein